jgi:predicted amidohydrolase YtcJ
MAFYEFYDNLGDKAAAQVISAIRQAGVPRYRRPILTHAQVLGPDLIEEMVHLGVIANIQPSFVITDAAFVNMRLDESCLPYAYCWKRMMEAGVVCAGGSDAPIETPNPFQGIYDAMFRSKDGKDKKSFFPNQCLTFPQALCMYTRNGAYAAMEENQLGEIRQNFKADFVILNENVVENFKSLLNPSLVSEVWIDGVQRYSQGDQKYVCKEEGVQVFVGAAAPAVRMAHLHT